MKELSKLAQSMSFTFSNPVYVALKYDVVKYTWTQNKHVRVFRSAFV